VKSWHGGPLACWIIFNTQPRTFVSHHLVAVAVNGERRVQDNRGSRAQASKKWRMAARYCLRVATLRFSFRSNRADVAWRPAGKLYPLLLGQKIHARWFPCGSSGEFHWRETRPICARF
jgi:hypothetical protein